MTLNNNFLIKGKKKHITAYERLHVALGKQYSAM